MSIKIHPERISKAGKDLVNDLDYEGIEFPVPKKDFGKIEKKIVFALMRFFMKMDLFILFMYHIRSLKMVWIYYW